MLVKKKFPLLAFETIKWITHHQVQIVCRNQFFSRKRNHAIKTIVIITIMCSYDSAKSFRKLEILNYSLLHCTKKRQWVYHYDRSQNRSRHFQIRHDFILFSKRNLKHLQNYNCSPSKWSPAWLSDKFQTYFIPIFTMIYGKLIFIMQMRATNALKNSNYPDI